MTKRLLVSIVIFLLAGILCNPMIPVTGAVQTEAQNFSSPSPVNFPEFKTTNTFDELTTANTWVLAPQLFFFPIIEQPQGNSAFVSNKPDILTRFKMADEYGSTAFLAHSHLAGRHFKEMQVGDFIYLIHNIRNFESYQVISIREFQALSPNSEYSSFIDLESDTLFSASELFLEIYGTSGRLVFQTCLEKNGVESWGRIFVVALPHHR